MQSMGAMRSSPTNTMQPAASIPPYMHTGPAATIPPLGGQSHVGKRIALGIVGLVAGGLITFGIATALKKSPSTAATAPQDAAMVAPAPADAAPTPPPPDAAPIAVAPPDAAPIAVAPPIDAGVPDAPERPVASSHHSSSSKKTGKLVVKAFPVLTVYVDGRRIRDTPVDMKLAAGKHKLRLVNLEVGKDEALTITIEENRTTNIER
jgi:hypothetical protein